MFKAATLLLAGSVLVAAQDYNKTQTIDARTADPKISISYWVDYTNTANPQLYQTINV